MHYLKHYFLPELCPNEQAVCCNVSSLQYMHRTQSIKIDSLLKVPRLFGKKDKQRNFLIFYVSYANLDQCHLAMESWEFSKQLSQTKLQTKQIYTSSYRKNMQKKF